MNMVGFLHGLRVIRRVTYGHVDQSSKSNPGRGRARVQRFVQSFRDSQENRLGPVRRTNSPPVTGL